MVAADRPESPALPRLLGAVASVAVAGLIFAVAALLPSAAVASMPPAHPPVASAGEEAEEEAEETSEDEFEGEGDGGWVELEPEETEAEGASSVTSAECPLRSARPAAIVDAAHEKLRIALRYTANRSTRVDARFQLVGGRGSLLVRSSTRRPALHGTLRYGQRLSPGALAKARAARTVIVRLEAPSAPARCDLTMRLAARHSSGARATWAARFASFD
jgi:hypothetical protein